MNNISFPNPQVSDALNDYLDALNSGKRPLPESDVEAAALEFNQLASRAGVVPPMQQSTEAEKGQQTMQTATVAAPISNRTRRRLESPQKSRSFGWLSMAIVAGLLISLIGSVWLNRAPRNPNENLAWAPGTAESIDGEQLLTTESAPWITAFDPADCTETSGLSEVHIDYPNMPASEPQGYGVVGPADLDDASQASHQYRSMRACTQLTDAWAYWTEARVNEHTRVLDDNSYRELADLQVYYAGIYPDQFMAVASDVPITPEIETEWAARQEAGDLGQAIPLEAKLNPEWALELSDGRIAFPATTIYSANDPAIIENGLPVENPSSSVVIIFAMEEGVWKYDDSLALCLVHCENGVGNPLDTAEATWAQSAESQTCAPQPMNPDVQTFDAQNVGEIDYTSRQYDSVGSANAEQASSAADIVSAWNTCSLKAGDTSTESMSYMTPLGLMGLSQLSNDGIGDPFTSAPYLRQWETGSLNLFNSTSEWNQIVVLDEPVRSTFGPAQWEPVIGGTGPNLSTVRRMQQGFSPTAATELTDGRITVFAVPTISVEDRGAITYEGNLSQQQLVGVALQQHDGAWLVDELLTVNSGVFLHVDSGAWWWDESFDSPAAFWTDPISYDECPQGDALTVTMYDPENPSYSQYTQEDYDQVSSERSYEIVGPADSADSEAVAARMRQIQACSERGESLPYFTARLEFETRTTAGREQMESLGSQRTDGADGLASWYEEELGLTPEGMWVYQDPEELPVDTPGLLQTRARINPDHALLLADGRIVTISSVVTYEPITHDILAYYAVYVYIWAEVDGEWLIDETLPICIGACELMPEDTSTGGDNRLPNPFATPEG